MRNVILFLAIGVCAIAQQPAPPQNLTAGVASAEVPSIISLTVTAGSDNPLMNPHLGLAAYWRLPTTNDVWITEWNVASVTGTNWQQTGNEWAGQDGWHYTETGNNWSNQWLARIRNLGPITPRVVTLSDTGSNVFVYLPPRAVRQSSWPNK